MRVRGAGAIAVAAAQALARFVSALPHSRATSAWELTLAAARRLDGARPTAVSLHNGLGAVLQAARPSLKGGDLSHAASAATAAAERVAREVDGARQRIAAAALPLLRGATRILTHCHSTTAVACLVAAAREHPGLEVVVTETRPWRQGLLTSRALAEAGVQVAYIVDSAVAHMIASEGIDAVVVGADAVASDGSLVNKVGTHAALRLAADAGVPRHCAAGVHKFSRRPAAAIPVEQRGRDEVDPRHELHPGVRVLNPVFDVSPAALVTRYLTEEGPLDPRAAVARAAGHLPPEEAWE